MAFSGLGSPLPNNGSRLVGDSDTAAVCTPTEDDLDGGLGVLLRRRGLPCGALEPGRPGREALRSEEGGSELFVLRTGELDVMGELVDERVAEVRSGSWDADNDGCRTGLVLRSVVEFPCGAQSNGRDAVQTLRVRGQEFVPRLVGDGAQVVGDRVFESQDGPRVWAHQKQHTGYDTDDQHSQSESSTHETRLPIPRSGEDCGPRVEYNGLTSTISQTRAMKEQQ